ncbi:hypothetical protein SEVIR_3G275600v4 [Setaria viridis]|uniref:Uncharacterized protein n=3 Tax=Setaria TaxID=4554 RepID=A0A368QJH8_SETIT|nr:NRR repressor homolog 1 [Setaria italica]XP_034587952.1 NRR repressor homolog 1-like [Setaria viridis]RCV18042.1 hypothetical protein SETIT_3G268600v2 [Setaria italica]TKW27715.1 hypothetical protein SEVIR_3G275600v2 [Setaria viridis]
MDGKKRARTEEMAAARPVTPAGRGDADASPSPARKAPLPDDAAADDEPVTAAEESRAGGVEDDEEEDDDEQVERFYALLANIRALRGLLPPHVAPSSSCGGGASSRKRQRAAEPPWRPAFRMEDFEEPAAPAPPSKRKHTEGAEDGDAESASGACPAVVVAPSLPHAAVRSDSGSCKN